MKKTLVNSKGESREVGDVDPVTLRGILKSGTKLAEALKDADLFLTPDGQLVSFTQENPACPAAASESKSWDRLLTDPNPKNT